MTKKYQMLVMTDARNNHNKFYEVKLEEDGTVSVRYGRVDGAVQTATKGQGERVFDRVVREKKAKGYRGVDVVVRDASGKIQRSLHEVARRDVAGGDPVLARLVERLVLINRHELMAASGGRITIEDGQVKTPVGLITEASVASAKAVLGQIQVLVARGKEQGGEYLGLLEDYLTLVPQKVPHARGWGPTFFHAHTTFQRQSDLLEQLEASLAMLRQAPEEPEDAVEIPQEKLFGYFISLVDDPRQVKAIQKLFDRQRNAKHVSSQLRLKAVYVMSCAEAEARYLAAAARVGNEKRLWHGTRACNLLSILKSGLIVPKSSGGNFTISGRMFGDGLYFSDQSTKSLNYSYGYWGHGAVDHNCFMFLCDVAMGRAFIPKGPGNGQRPGYDSCFAKAGRSGVFNNEMIVYDIDQARLAYLCEFDKA